MIENVGTPKVVITKIVKYYKFESIKNTVTSLRRGKTNQKMISHFSMKGDITSAKVLRINLK